MPKKAVFKPKKAVFSTFKAILSRFRPFLFQKHCFSAIYIAFFCSLMANFCLSSCKIKKTYSAEEKRRIAIIDSISRAEKQILIDDYREDFNLNSNYD